MTHKSQFQGERRGVSPPWIGVDTRRADAAPLAPELRSRFQLCVIDRAK